MQRRGPRVVFVAFADNPAGDIRARYPAQALYEAGYDVAIASKRQYPEPGSCDVLVVHRPLPEDQPHRDRHRDAGAKVIVSEDDDLRSIPPSFPPEAIPSPIVLAAHELAIEESDGIIVTTARLRDVYGGLAPRCWIVPNYLPRWISSCTSKIDRLTVGWAGTVITHRHDLEWLKPVAERARAGARLSLVGDHRAADVLHVRHEVEHHGWSIDARRLYRLMSRAHVGMVPLDPTIKLNWAKSWLKQLEYTMLGRPTVVVDLPEQKSLAKKTGAALVASSPEEFADHVQRLLADETLRERMGECARKAARHMAIEKHVKEWATVIEEAAA